MGHSVDVNDRDALRARLRSQRTALTPATRIAAASGIAAALEQLPEFLIDARIAGYWAIGGELPLNIATARLASRRQQYHLPVLVPQRRLRFAPWQLGIELQPNRFGIPEPRCSDADLLEPQALDLVLVPLLGFDRRGHRLGSGGGYYDRTFSFLQAATRPTQPLLVGIGYSFAEQPGLPDQAWDVKMDFVATERELIDCTEATQEQD